MKKLLCLFFIITLQVIAQTETVASLRMRKELYKAIEEIYPRAKNLPNFSDVQQQLSNEDINEKLRAVIRLKDFDDNHNIVIPLLIKFLKDPNKEIREEAAWGLSFLNKHAYDAIPFLVKNLGDKEWGPKRSAAYALAVIGVQKIIPQLILSENIEVRATTARILYYMEDEVLPFTEAVKELLEDKEEKVKNAALLAWENIEKYSGEKEIIKAIANSASSKDSLKRKATLKYLKSLTLKDMRISTLGILVKLCKDSNFEIKEAACDILLNLEEAKGPFVDKNIPKIQIERISRWSVRRRTKRALQQLDINYITTAFPRLMKEIKSFDWKTRRRALDRLGEIGKVNPDIIIPAITKCLFDENEEVQLAAAFALGNLGTLASKTAPDLIKILSTDYWRLRRGAAMALAEIGAIKEILQLAEHKNPNMRQMAARALYDLEEKALDYTDTIQKLLQDPDKDVREEAQHSWKNVQEYKKFFEEVEEGLQLTVSESVKDRIQAIKFLSSTGILAVPTFLKFLQDPDTRVRQQARKILLGIQNMEAIKSQDIIKRLTKQKRLREKK
ncbi:HEAT repeat domain-containing protein [Candidatus Uabimicrobium sp. HlEnr_7]|uniref:HEAT repeat domain-containing protein n=1 Tax=Candidatus Uabimicrobium helgolandensis TaxID=3095367 RepID=UPI003555C872